MCIFFKLGMSMSPQEQVYYLSRYESVRFQHMMRSCQKKEAHCDGQEQKYKRSDSDCGGTCVRVAFDQMGCERVRCFRYHRDSSKHGGCHQQSTDLVKGRLTAQLTA